MTLYDETLGLGGPLTRVGSPRSRVTLLLYFSSISSLIDLEFYIVVFDDSSILSYDVMWSRGPTCLCVLPPRAHVTTWYIIFSHIFVTARA